MICELKKIIGATLVRCENVGGDSIEFETSDGRTFRMYHESDCCEHVYIEDINGDLNDLLGAPILVAEENSNSDDPKSPPDESFTWTFYRFAAIKGHVVIRWYGSSNGYYSESVDFFETTNNRSRWDAVCGH